MQIENTFYLIFSPILTALIYLILTFAVNGMTKAVGSVDAEPYRGLSQCKYITSVQNKDQKSGVEFSYFLNRLAKLLVELLEL